MKTKTLIIAGTVIFLTTLVAKTPASIVTEALSKNTGLTIHGANGSLWNGSARHVQIGDFPLGTVDWKLTLAGLTKGKPGIQFTTRHTDLSSSGTAFYGLDHSLELQDTRFDAQASALNQMQQYFTLNGKLLGNIRSLSIAAPEDQQAPLITGTINLENAAMSSPLQLTEGHYQIQLLADANTTAGKLASNDAPVELGGQISLSTDWEYMANITIKPTEKGQSLKKMLRMAGPTGADGTTSIKYKGNIKGLVYP